MSKTNISQKVDAALINVTQMQIIGANASNQQQVFVAPKTFPTGCKGITILDFVIASDTGVTANDTNYWSFQVTNVTQSADLLAAAQTTKATGGTAITADTIYQITPDQNATIGYGDVLELDSTKAASGTDLSSAIIGGSVKWQWKMEV